jgi:hypothetical protein
MPNRATTYQECAYPRAFSMNCCPPHTQLCTKCCVSSDVIQCPHELLDEIVCALVYYLIIGEQQFHPVS